MEKVINQAITHPDAFTKLLGNLRNYDEHMNTFLQTITRQDFDFGDQYVSDILSIQFNKNTLQRALVYYKKLMSQNALQFVVLLLNAIYRLLAAGVACQEYYFDVFRYLNQNYNSFAAVVKKALGNHFIQLHHIAMTSGPEQLQNAHLHYEFLFALAERISGFQVELLDEAVKLLLELDLYQSNNLGGAQSYDNNAELSEDAICSSLKTFSMQNIHLQPDAAHLLPFYIDVLGNQYQQSPETLMFLIDHLLTQISLFLQRQPQNFVVSSFLPIFFDKMLPVLPPRMSCQSPFLVFPLLANPAYLNIVISNLLKTAFAAPNTGIGVAINACCYLAGALAHFDFKQAGLLTQALKALSEIAAELSHEMPACAQFQQLRPAHQRAAIAGQTLIAVLNCCWQVVDLNEFGAHIEDMLRNNLFCYLGQPARDFWEVIADIYCYSDEVEQAVMLQAGRCQEREVVFDVFQYPQFSVFSQLIKAVWTTQ